MRDGTFANLASAARSIAVAVPLVVAGMLVESAVAAPQPPQEEAIARAALIKESISPVALQVIGSWVGAQVGLPPR